MIEGRKNCRFEQTSKEVGKGMEKLELETCMNEYGRALCSFCSYLACDRQEAEDLYQDTFLKALELGDRIDREQNPKSYLLSIALRIWRNRKRKYAWRKRIADVRPMNEERDGDCLAESGEGSPEEAFLGKEEREAVRNAVRRLPDRLKTTVLLYYMEELSAGQISQIMKVPKGTVLSRLHQARKLLKKELERVLDEERIG